MSSGGGGYGQPPPGGSYRLPGALGDVTVERLPPKQRRPRPQDDELEAASGQPPAAVHPVRPRKPQHRPADSTDDMDLDDTIDSRIGVRMEAARGHRRSSSPQLLQPSDDEDEELLDDDDDDDDPDLAMDGVNILDSLPLEGAPIEGQEVSEADLLGKMDEDEDELDEEDEKSSSRSGEEDFDSGKRASTHDGDSVKKKQKKDESVDKQTELDMNKTEKKLSNMRRNIREVMDETQLDEATLAAQRQEMERLRRVQEQQRIIREVQRRQHDRGISLLRCNQNALDSSEIRLPSSVMLSKVTPGSQSQLGSRRPVGESSRWQQQQQMSISRVGGRGSQLNQQGCSLQQRIRMMTPSVSISPVVPKRDESPEPEALEYYTDSDLSELEAEEAELLEREEAQSKRLAQAGLAPSTKAGIAKPAKGKDVVTISSSSESSDDDCIVLSDHSDAEADDDPSNSGMHTNDRYNLPDEDGRVLVNVGHPDDEPDVYLAPQVARVIKPHQIGGIRFLYDNIIESIDRYKTSSGFGCILAHSMGLGKTLQVANFCDIFFRCTGAKTVLCIMPINTLQNWLAEFNMWLPYEDPNKPKVEEKPIKEEVISNNPSLDSKPATEFEPSANPQQQHEQQMPQQQSHPQQPPGMLQGNPYQPQPGYNQAPVPPYGPNPGEMYDPRYGPPYPGAPGYIKTENPCQSTDMYGMDNRGMPQYNSGYPPNMQQPNVPPNMQYPPHTYSGSGVDPNAHSNVPGMNNPTPSSMMPQVYGPNSTAPQPNYGNVPAPPSSQPTDVKKVEDAAVQDQKVGVNQGVVKAEVKEEVKNSTDELKKDCNDEKKDTASIKTPFSVDAPLDLEIRPRHFSLHILNDSHKTMAARARVVREWQRVGGVLLIGYELYRQLSLKKPNRAKRKRGQPFKDPMLDAEEEDKNKPLLDEMQAALVNPGPDLVICDEGHRIKNSHASTSLALKQMRTKRRVVLTGYPLQNNLLEYWCMVDFVRPNYLGTKSEFCNMFERPIQNGQCIDSTPQDMRLMRYRAHVLHALLEGFVQRRSHTVLQMSLPQKEEYILLVRMTPHQRKLYDTFMNQVVKTRAVPNPLKAFAVCCKIWNHPDILYHFLKKRQQANEEDDLDLEETMGEKATPATGTKRVPKPRAPKGEGKRGRKPKNKPAASVQPNSSTTPVESAETEGQNQKQAFPFNAPAPPQPDGMVGFPNPDPNNQNPYQQQHQQQQHSGYQNYNGGEYNEFYGNQTQQKYPHSTAQGFPQDSQNTSYAPGCPTQQYQGQPNCPPAPGQQYPEPSTTGSTTPAGNPTLQQDQNQVIGSGSNFPQPNYPYPNQEKNFPSTNFNQNPNYPQQALNQQAPKQPPMSGYGPYPTQNQNQGYSAHNQSLENSNMNYQNNQLQQTSQNQNTSAPGVAPNYMANNPLGPNFPQQIQNSSNLISNQPPYSNQTPQANQNAPPTPNQSYPVNQAGANSMMGPAGMAFNPNNQQQQQQQPPSAYPQDNSQNQMKNYQNIQNQPSGYMQHQMPSNQNLQNQQIGYSGGQYGQQSQQQFPSQLHEFQQQQQSQQPQQPSSQVQSQQNQHLSQPHGYGAQTPGFQPDSQVPNQMGYSSQTSSNQGSAAYSTNNPPQNHAISTRQNQVAQYAQNIGSQNMKNTALDSQNIQNQTVKIEPGYPQPNSQNVQADSVVYSATQATPHGFPATNSQMPNSQQAQSVTPSQNQYWQGNYQNQNNPYHNVPNVNQYQNNQYQGDSKTLSENCQTNQQNQPGQQFDNYPMNRMDSKSVQEAGPLQHGQNFLPSSNPNTLHDPQHQLQPSNLPTNCVAPQNNPTNTESNMSKSVQSSNQSTEDHGKGENKNNEFGIDKSVNIDLDKSKENKSDEELLAKDEIEKEKALIAGAMSNMKEDMGIPYDWAYELMKNYVPGLIDASAKMTIFFCILNEAIQKGDRVLTFSQSLFTLNLIEDFLARNDFKYKDGQTESWAKNVNYYRLDGSTSALEREKLINEFNVNPKIHLFLVSTRAGSLGINLVGANRAIVFDASWNPCHDTQAVCRVYRYGQQKSCFVYRLVTDNCLERKIYDRQISKQGMADRVVDQCNPDAHLSLKEATTLSWDWEEDSKVQDFSDCKDSFSDEIMRTVLEKHSSLLTKKPFHHESLLVDRKEKKLSQAEKRLARRGYELEKMASTCARPSYNYVPGNTAPRVSVSSGLQIRQIGPTAKPVASVRPMQQRGADGLNARNPSGSRWIPAEVWQRQGMSAQEMTLPLDVVIPTNSPDKGSIVLKAGQRVMVLKSPKGIYMQLESGKIIAIRTALKINEQKKQEEMPKKSVPVPQPKNSMRSDIGFPLRNNSAISIIPKPSSATSPQQQQLQGHPGVRTGVNYRPFGEKEVAKRAKPVATAAARPYSSGQIRPNPVTLSRISRPRQDSSHSGSDVGDNSNSSDGHLLRGVGPIGGEAANDTGSDYSPSSSRPSTSDTDSRPHFPASGASPHVAPPQRDYYAPGEPPKQPDAPTPRRRATRGRGRGRGVPRVTSDVVISPAGKRPPGTLSPLVRTGQKEPAPPEGYPYAQYPRYYDYAEQPRPRQAAPATPPSPAAAGRGRRPAAKSGPGAESKSSAATPVAAAGAGTQQTAPAPPTATREEPQSPTAFSHPANARPPYAAPAAAGPYPPGPYDPYAQHYPPAPGGSAPYAPPPAAAPAYPPYGGPSYNADYNRMYPPFHGAPPPAGDPYRGYGAAPPPGPGYYPPFPHAAPPYSTYSFMPAPYPNPGAPAEPRPPAQ